MKYVATDGTVFTDRSLYRKHEMETQYTFRGKRSTRLIKAPGTVTGQPFDIADCERCEILVLGHCDQVQIDNVCNSKIFIGASSGSIFARNCKNCTFTVACKQLRLRDCENCTFNLHVKTDPVIESSNDIKFAPFNGSYPGHREDMLNAGLDPSINRWKAVYDFNDPSETKDNWRILLPEEQDPVWSPLGDTESSSGSIKNDECVDDVDSDGGEQSSVDYESVCDDETGPFHKIKAFGCCAWGFLTGTVFSIQAFCLGLIFNAWDIPKKMISQH